MELGTFRTRTQRTVFEKVQRYLHDIFGEAASVSHGEPKFLISKGSARADVCVQPWGEEEATITVRSLVVRQCERTPELLDFLLQENCHFRLGAFALDPQGRVALQHTLIGTTCDKKELELSVSAILVIADEYDDRIRQRWGGLRATD